MIIQLNMASIQWAVAACRLSVPATSHLDAHYPNTLKSHLVGKLGELAVEKWAVPLFTVDSVFRDRTRIAECDLIVNGKRIEIKTWSASSWGHLGRCVRPKQLASHASRTDIFLWTHLVEDLSDPENPPTTIQVVLAGVSTVEDVQRSPIWITRSLPNHQVRIEDMRPLSLIG